MIRANVNDCRLVDLPKVGDPRGNLTVVEGDTIPFVPRRVFWLYDVPGGESRAGHAHRTLQEFIVAANGSFDVEVFDGHASQRFCLRRSYVGLYVPAMIWRTLDNFSSGSVCLVLASEHYDPNDYYRHRGEYVAAVAG